MYNNRLSRNQVERVLEAGSNVILDMRHWDMGTLLQLSSFAKVNRAKLILRGCQDHTVNYIALARAGGESLFFDFS